MPLRSEVGSHEVVYFEESLGLLGRFKAFHPTLAQPGRLRRVFRSMIQVTALAVSDARQNDLLRRSITAKLVRNNHARLTPGGAQQFPKEQNRGPSIPSGLHGEYRSRHRADPPPARGNAARHSSSGILHRGTIYRPAWVAFASVGRHRTDRICCTSSGRSRSSTKHPEKPSSVPHPVS
jgi:hypothetical protein